MESKKLIITKGGGEDQNPEVELVVFLCMNQYEHS